MVAKCEEPGLKRKGAKCQMRGKVLAGDELVQVKVADITEAGQTYGFKVPCDRPSGRATFFEICTTLNPASNSRLMLARRPRTLSACPVSLMAIHAESLFGIRCHRVNCSVSQSIIVRNES